MITTGHSSQLYHHESDNATNHVSQARHRILAREPFVRILARQLVHVGRRHDVSRPFRPVQHCSQKRSSQSRGNSQRPKPTVSALTRRDEPGAGVAIFEELQRVAEPKRHSPHLVRVLPRQPRAPVSRTSALPRGRGDKGRSVALTRKVRNSARAAFVQPVDVFVPSAEQGVGHSPGLSCPAGSTPCLIMSRTCPSMPHVFCGYLGQG